MAKRQRFPPEEAQDRRIARAVCSAAAGDPELTQRLARIDNRSPSAVIALLAVLVGSHDESVQLRVSAADALLSASSLLSDDAVYYRTRLNIGFEEFKRALIDETSAVRIQACHLIGRTRNSPRVMRILGTALDDPVPDVVLAALSQIHWLSRTEAEGRQRVAQLVPQLCELLQHNRDDSDDDKIHNKAIDILRHLGELAIESIKPLVTLALDEDCPEDSRSAAAEALATIDAEGERIVALLRDVEEVDELAKVIFTMTSATALGNSLRRRCDDIRRGPSPGFARLQMKDLMALIFGRSTATDADERKRIDSRQRKQIRGWLDSGVLNGMRVKQGLYDVRESDLERLTNLNRGKAPKDD